MYQSFFGLRDDPFRMPPDSRYLYLSPSHRASLEALVHGIEEGARLLVLTGEPGVGKSMLLHTLLEHLDSKVTTASVFYAGLQFQDFLQYLLADFGIETTARTSEQYLSQLHHWLIERYDKENTTVLFIDEAQSLPLDLLANLPKLLDLEFAGEPLLQIVLAGQSTLHETLRDPKLQPLRQRIASICELKPLSAAETQAYILHRFAIAGGDAHTVFPPRTFKAIYTATAGIPRLIHTVCDTALVTSYAIDEHQISPRTMREAAQDLGWGAKPETSRTIRRIAVSVFALCLVLATALYVVPQTSIASRLWAQIHTVAHHGYQSVTTHMRASIPVLVTFVKNLGAQLSSSRAGAERGQAGATANSPGTHRLSNGNAPERHIEQEEIQAIVQH